MSLSLYHAQIEHFEPGRTNTRPSRVRMEEESEPGTCRAFAAETNRRNTSADRGTPRTFGRQSKRPIRRVKIGLKATLRRAGVPHFPIHNLRHAFCARLSRVAPDAVIRHTSPETKRIYQLSMVEQVARSDGESESAASAIARNRTGDQAYLGRFSSNRSVVRQ